MCVCAMQYTRLLYCGYCLSLLSVFGTEFCSFSLYCIYMYFAMLEFSNYFLKAKIRVKNEFLGQMWMVWGCHL